MKVSRGEIVEVNYPLPNGIFKPHPVIVLSDYNVNDFEEAFICAMISGVDYKDEFSFYLSDEMYIGKKLIKKCQVRCQLISLFHQNDIIQKISSLKKVYVDKIATHIFKTCLSKCEE